jgi:hypothetical protein
VQCCSNIHGCFLTIEEFDGRQRTGSVVILEGRFGQGWDRFISEVRLANSALCGVKAGKKGQMVKERRSYAEVLAMMVNPAEQCFGPCTEPLARVPRWLKESSAGLEKFGVGMVSLSTNQTQTPARALSGQDKAGTQYPNEMVMVGIKTTMAKAPTSGLQTPVKEFALNDATEEACKRREVSECQTHFGASLDLLNCRETLRWLKGEIDVGLQKLELTLNRVEVSGLLQAERGPLLPHSIRKGSEQKEKDGAAPGPRPTRGFKTKKKVAVYKLKSFVGLGMGLDSPCSSGPVGIRPINFSYPKTSNDTLVGWQTG